MASTTKIIVAAIVVVIIAAAGYYWYYTTSQPRTTEITLMTKAGLWADFIRNSGVLEDYKERMLKEKNVKVEVTIITAPHRGYGEKLITSFAAGSEGDVCWVSPTDVFRLAETEYLLDLTPYVSKWADWEKFYPAARNAYTIGGKVYAVPNDAATMVLYYRKDLFKKAGLPVPWQPETWDDVIEVALKLKEKFPDLPMIIEAWYEEQLPVYSDGGVIYDPSDGKFIAKSPQLLYLFKLYYDIIYKYGLMPKEFKLEGWDDRKLFAEGKLPLMIDGTWCYTEKWGPNGPYPIENREEVIGYAHPPSSGRPNNPHGKYPNTFRDYAWVISARTKEPELAFELIKELTRADIMAKWGYETSHLVVRTDAMIGDYAKDKFLEWNTEALKYAVPKPTTTLFNKYMDALKEVLRNELLINGRTPEECLDIFAEKVTEKLGEENVKEISIP